MLRGFAAVLGLAIELLFAPLASAQETTGRITGVVTDQATGGPAPGITVVVQGPQGEDATITDDRGVYTFANLKIGTYVVRFYAANGTTHVERSEVPVSAGATIRADVMMPAQATQTVETVVIRKRAPAVDVGSARLGLSLGEDYTRTVPLQRTFGDILDKAPGAFVESSGNVSIAGASGLENIYIVDGLNVTGMDYGDIMNRRRDAGGGSNLVLDFVKELQINTGGYRAEFGGAMGGVVNVITKSGSNEFHGSVFSYWSPYWLAANPLRLTRYGVAVSGVEKPDYDTNIGFEVGGPIIRNRLFFWAGFAPRHEKSHFFRDVTPLLDENNDGLQDTDSTTKAPLFAAPVSRTRLNQSRKTYQLGVKLDFLVAPEHRLTLSLFTSPASSNNLRVFPSAPGLEFANHPDWAMQALDKTNTDVALNWVSHLMDRRWRIEANAGLHREYYNDRSPHARLNTINQIEVHGASLGSLERIAGCTPTAAGFDPCPVDIYHLGGYGLVRSFTGNRWMGEVKSTHIGTLVFPHELKYGVRGELNQFDQTRYYSGPLGSRALVQSYPGAAVVWNFFSLPRGTYPFQFTDDDPNNGTVEQLRDPPYYQDALVASVKSTNLGYFVQDTMKVLPNLVLDLGVRLDNQRMRDFRGDQFLNLMNWGPRAGVIFDPSNEGRTKLFSHYGRFYETIPMNLAARFFGGEGIAASQYDTSACGSAEGWQGGEWRQCGAPAGVFFANNGAPYPVQPRLKGQSHHEIVAGMSHALTENLVLSVDYTHRWLSHVIEDGTASPNFEFVLANPGQIPDDVLRGLEGEIAAKQQQLAGGGGTDADRVALQALESKLANLKGLATQPKAKRTYDAVTFSAMKRLARNWLLRASYTYSRLIGNYNGLFDPDNGYFAPNGSNAYDTPELSINRYGPLANDRPHSGHVDGYYELPVGRGTLVGGLSFSAYSGTPRNHMSEWVLEQQVMFLLPRGSAGRTPTITQTDVKIAYRHPLSKTTAVEGFIDLFNIFNERTPLRLDDDYTLDMAAAIPNGTVEDLRYAKNVTGAPVKVNPNFGRPLAYQLPFHARLGLRVLF